MAIARGDKGQDRKKTMMENTGRWGSIRGEKDMWRGLVLIQIQRRQNGRQSCNLDDK